MYTSSSAPIYYVGQPLVVRMSQSQGAAWIKSSPIITMQASVRSSASSTSSTSSSSSYGYGYSTKMQMHRASPPPAAYPSMFSTPYHSSTHLSPYPTSSPRSSHPALSSPSSSPRSSHSATLSLSSPHASPRTSHSTTHAPHNSPHAHQHHSKSHPHPPPTSVPTSVSTLLGLTRQLQDVLHLWSLSSATSTQVSDAYVLVGMQFHAACAAFGRYGVDMSDLYHVTADLRNVLEQCLGEDEFADMGEGEDEDEYSPSGGVGVDREEILERYMPRVRTVLYDLLQGLQRKQGPYWRAVEGEQEQQEDMQHERWDEEYP